jgi:hypothetical protein
MKEQIVQQMMWIPERGVTPLIQPHAQYTNANGSTALEAERLRLMTKDGTLKKRYPTPDQGLSFMQEVCMDRRNELLETAKELTPKIVSEWGSINAEKPIGVVIFGSTAKGLVKHNENPDPSNIDIAVIGNITDVERSTLLRAIRPHRDAAEEKMYEACPDCVNKPNAGVHVQHVSKLTNGHHTEALNYIASGAFPLYDPTGMWKRVEEEALTKSVAHQAEKKQRRRYVKDRELDTVHQSLLKQQRKSEQKQKREETVIYQNLPLPGLA